jgi:hypothetical protein
MLVSVLSALTVAALALPLYGGASATDLRGDSTRPGVEVPSNALPPSATFERTPSVGSPLRGEGDRPNRGLREHFPGEAEFPTGARVPGELDEPGEFRPGDLQPGPQEPRSR